MQADGSRFGAVRFIAGQWTRQVKLAAKVVKLSTISLSFWKIFRKKKQVENDDPWGQSPVNSSVPRLIKAPRQGCTCTSILVGWARCVPFHFRSPSCFLCEEITRTVTQKKKTNFSLRPTAEQADGGGSRRTSHATRRGGGQVSSWWKNSIPLRCSSSLDRNFLGRTQEKRLMSIASLVECFVSKTVGCGRLFHDIFHRFVWPTNDQSFSCDPLIVAHRQTIAAAEEMTSSRASLAW